MLHECVLVLGITTLDVPYVPGEGRAKVTPLGAGCYRVEAAYGFMQQPDMADILAAVAAQGIPCHVGDTTFYLSRETILPTTRPGMARWREALFAFLSRNTTAATAYFGIPAHRVVELGVQLEI